MAHRRKLKKGEIPVLIKYDWSEYLDADGHRLWLIFHMGDNAHATAWEDDLKAHGMMDDYRVVVPKATEAFPDQIMPLSQMFMYDHGWIWGNWKRSIKILFGSRPEGNYGSPTADTIGVVTKTL